MVGVYPSKMGGRNQSGFENWAKLPQNTMKYHSHIVMNWIMKKNERSEQTLDSIHVFFKGILAAPPKATPPSNKGLIRPY